MTAHRLAVEELGFAYPGTLDFLFTGLTFDIQGGEMVAVTGRSGSGKSTLLFLLGLFIRPTVGRVRIAGVDTASLSDRERSGLRAHAIGFVFQDAILHPSISIEDNVAEGALYAGAAYGSAIERARQLLADFGIADLRDRLPARVSGGQAQRAALCRALMRRPQLVLADEPTGNLDTDNAAAVVAGLRQAAADGAAVLIVTHNGEIAGSCDRTVALT